MFVHAGSSTHINMLEWLREVFAPVVSNHRASAVSLKVAERLDASIFVRRAALDSGLDNRKL